MRPSSFPTPPPLVSMCILGLIQLMAPDSQFRASPFCSLQITTGMGSPMISYCIILTSIIKKWLVELYGKSSWSMRPNAYLLLLYYLLDSMCIISHCPLISMCTISILPSNINPHQSNHSLVLFYGDLSVISLPSLQESNHSKITKEHTLYSRHAPVFCPSVCLTENRPPSSVFRLPL